MPIPELAQTLANLQRWNLLEVTDATEAHVEVTIVDDRTHHRGLPCGITPQARTNTRRAVLTLLDPDTHVCTHCATALDPFRRPTPGFCDPSTVPSKVLHHTYRSHELLEAAHTTGADPDATLDHLNRLLTDIERSRNFLVGLDLRHFLAAAPMTAAVDAALPALAEAEQIAQDLASAPARQREWLTAIRAQLVPESMRPHVRLDYTPTLITLTPAGTVEHLPLLPTFRFPGLPAGYERDQNATVLLGPRYLYDYLHTRTPSVAASRLLQALDVSNLDDHQIGEILTAWDTTGTTPMVNLTVARDALAAADT